MNKYPKLQNKKWLENQFKTKTMREVATEVGCSYSAVHYMSVEHGITVPQRRKYHVSVDKSAISKRAYEKKYPNGRHGEQSGNWRGGIRQVGGYVRIYMPNHPNAVQGSVFEHTLIAEKSIGRYIQSDEIVHHINGKKNDNRPENLEVCKRSEHIHKHFTDGKNIQALHGRIAYLEQLLVDNSIPFN
jgi:hypothetical protein